MFLIEKKYDKEYSCQWPVEQMYLSDNGIKYTFVKNVSGVTTYKYKKSKKLFSTLAKFYGNLEIYE